MTTSDRHVRELVLVRHGETTQNRTPKMGRFLADASAQRELGGLPDHRVPLTDRGRAQASAAGVALRPFGPFDLYFDSDYERTRETLDLILEEFPESERDSEKRRSHLDLREREPGYPFTMTAAEVETYFPWYPQYEARFGRLYSTPPGGESIAHVCSRVHMFLNSLRRRRHDARILVVTHGRVMMCFRYWLEGMRPSQLEALFASSDIPNCTILRYLRRGDSNRFLKSEVELPPLVVDESST